MTRSAEKSRRVLICQGTGCVSTKSPDIQAALEQEVEKLGLTNVQVELTGCHGFCQQGPIAVIEPDGIFYAGVQVKDAADIASSHLRDDVPVERLFYKDPNTRQVIPRYADIPFYKGQQRVLLRHCGTINPEKIDQYLAADGYEAQKKALHEMAPSHVVDEIKASGLRGRGGAGFPTGTKWEFCAREESDEKFVVCNADEGDPGAFMDRSILEASPHSVIEGMVIAGHAIGAHRGYIYVRAEYPLAIERLEIALAQARQQNLLGENIMGSGFSFDLDLFEGAGAFVCGEETALLLSIEGHRGMPRPRPPFPAQSGLWGKPTLIDNVKSLAFVPEIIHRGSGWFAGIGTEKSKGTAVFALTGNIANSGLIEVPMGTPLRHIIYEIGGGVQDGKPFKAVQTGGPSGGCLPASHLDTPVDYESLAAAGSIMGSGGMVVMDDETCMVDVSRYFLDFTQKESCGECAPCRLGTKQMLDILERICKKKGRSEDIALLEEMGEAIKAGSLCGLGQTAPNPVLTTLRYFRDEYVAHIEEESCPAKMCRDFVYYRIMPEHCNGCHSCATACPQDTIFGEKKAVHVIDQTNCIQCGICFESCAQKVIAVERLTGKEALTTAAAG